MDRTERFYKIELMIRTRGTVSFADLMAELEVSRATLKRDLEYLRSRMSAPIVYDRASNGYRLDAPARRGGSRPATDDAPHELPGLWFSEREIHALLSMHQLIDSLDTGATLGRHLHPLQEKLHHMLGSESVDPRELMKRVRIVHPARRPVAHRTFEHLASALLARKRVELTYFSRGRQVESHREISPQRLVHYRNTWYLDAWCHASEGLRRFALDAVRHAKVNDRKAKDVGLRTVEAELDGGYGVYGGRETRTAVLRFSPEAARWVAHEQWHARQELEPLQDGGLRMRLPYADDTELVMDLMRQGGEVEVEAPPELRRKVAERLRLAAGLYAD